MPPSYRDIRLAFRAAGRARRTPGRNPGPPARYLRRLGRSGRARGGAAARVGRLPSAVGTPGRRRLTAPPPTRETSSSNLCSANARKMSPSTGPRYSAGVMLELARSASAAAQSRRSSSARSLTLDNAPRSRQSLVGDGDGEIAACTLRARRASRSGASALVPMNESERFKKRGLEGVAAGATPHQKTSRRKAPASLGETPPTARGQTA
jgi:hypothetical protein